MSKQTTTLLTIGPLSTSNWGDTQAWRISSQAQLVEGGIAHWIVTPTLPAEHAVENQAVILETPEPIFVVHSILLIAATWHGSESLIGYLIDTENIRMEGDKRVIAPYWDLSDETAMQISQLLSNQVKLGFTIFEEMTLVDEEVISSLRRLGFHVDVFTKREALSSAL